MDGKQKRFWANAFGALGASLLLVVGMATIARPVISENAGLAVAQSSTLWNNVRDASAGDSLSSGVMATSPYVFNGLTFDRLRGDTTNGLDVDVTRLPGGTNTPADALTSPSGTGGIAGFGMVWNGATWDRIREANADALTNATGLRAAPGMGFNNVTWDRLRTASAATNTAASLVGGQLVVQAGTWSLTNTPAVATQATASRAAGGGTVRHVATTVSWCVAANATAQTPLLIHLRDGATGAGTILRSWAVSAVVGTSQCGSESGLNITGSANTAMTIETAAAPAANVQATVNLSGYDTP